MSVAVRELGLARSGPDVHVLTICGVLRVSVIDAVRAVHQTDGSRPIPVGYVRAEHGFDQRRTWTVRYGRAMHDAFRGLVGDRFDAEGGADGMRQ